jgi:RHS repeat-associated protein
MGSTTWLSFSAGYGGHGQILTQSSNGSSQLFTYDNAGRLTQVADTDQTVNPVACTTRVYTYDADTNRLSLTSYPGSSPGVCSTSTTPTVTSHTYDQADRISNSGYAYDPLGRTTTVPAVDAGGTNALTVGYYVNDMVASQVQSSSSKSFALDPTERLTTITTGFSVQTNRYADGSDSPAWISMSDGSWTRNVRDIAGSLGAIVSSNGSDELQLVNLHGDLVATATNISGAMGVDAYFESTEFAVARGTNPVTPRYAWLGAKLRDSGDAIAGLILMGVRIYSPALGRFLQTDPVAGGSANDYDYCSADPVNCTDLAGTNGCLFGNCSSSRNPFDGCWVCSSAPFMGGMMLNFRTGPSGESLPLPWQVRGGVSKKAGGRGMKPLSSGGFCASTGILCMLIKRIVLLVILGIIGYSVSNPHKENHEGPSVHDKHLGLPSLRPRRGGPS